MTKISRELAYCVRYDMERDLFHAQNVFSDEYITPTFVKYVQKLENENTFLKNENKILKEGKTNVFAELNDENARSNELLMYEIADLRKENAELNNFIMQSKKDGISPINALIIKNLDNQLTKAKFLLKRLVDSFPKSYSDVVKDTLAEAEQFLSEVENDN